MNQYWLENSSLVPVILIPHKKHFIISFQFLYTFREKYVDHVHRLQPHVLRLNRRLVSRELFYINITLLSHTHTHIHTCTPHFSEEESSSVNSMKVTFENEYPQYLPILDCLSSWLVKDLHIISTLSEIFNI